MARTPKRVNDATPVNRVIEIPGWVYNLLIDRAHKERRPVKSQIEIELERWGERQLVNEDDDEGQSEAVPIFA
jgi:hypothetical protein